MYLIVLNVYTEIKTTMCQKTILQDLLTLHRGRIHARLKSRKWKRPQYLTGVKDLTTWQELKRLSNHPSLSAATNEAQGLQIRLGDISSLYKEHDEVLEDTAAELNHLEDVVRQSYNFCSSNGTLCLRETLTRAGLNASHLCRNKHIRQLDKIGTYFRITKTLAKAAKKYKTWMAGLRIEYLSPFKPVWSEISLKGKKVSCHVHAEVQLVVFYDLTTPPGRLKTRVIGTSKATCFLCQLFIKEHGSYFVAQEHARLHEQWTIPDMAEYNGSHVKHLRGIIGRMDSEICRLLNVKHPPRPFPGTSWQDLRQLFPFSPPSSSAQTVTSLSEQDFGSGGSRISLSGPFPPDQSLQTAIEALELSGLGLGSRGMNLATFAEISA